MTAAEPVSAPMRDLLYYAATSLGILFADVALFAAAVACGLPYLVANAVIFVALSLAQFAFLRRRLYALHGWCDGFIVFIAIGSIGLVLQSVLLWVGISVCQQSPLLIKVVAVTVAFLFVYHLRRRMLRGHT